MYDFDDFLDLLAYVGIGLAMLVPVALILFVGYMASTN